MADQGLGRGMRGWRAIFHMDVRSLALYRIGIAWVLFADWCIRAQFLRMHYTDSGVLPRTLLIERMQELPSFSLHMLSGHWFPQACLFALGMVAALCLMLGYKTRAATFVSWVLIVSIQVRNPMVLNAGDSLLALSLFWAMFLPLGACYSMDRLRHPDTVEIPQTIASAATIAYMLQIACVYWFSVLLKSGAPWRTDFTAVFYTLHLNELIKPMALVLREHIWLMPLLAAFTIWAEIVAPALLFMTAGKGRIRCLGVFILFGMHFGFQLCIELGLFAFITIIVLFPLLPHWFWEVLVQWWQNHKESRPGQRIKLIRDSLGRVFQLTQTWLLKGKAPARRTIAIQNPRPTKLLIALCIVIMLWHNVESVRPSQATPTPLAQARQLLQLDQGWAMFAPAPPQIDGWYVIFGQLEDDSEIDVFKAFHRYKGGNKVDWKRYKYLIPVINNPRWTAYWMGLWEMADGEKDQAFWPPLMRNLCKDWNQRHPPAKHLVGARIFYVYENNHLSGARLKGETLQLWAGFCDGTPIKDDNDDQKK